MDEPLIFGARASDVHYAERHAAYVVVLDGGGRVAAVRARQGYFLPGGGSLPGESPEATVAREVREELARGVRLTRRIGEAIQYFYSSADACHYRMLAAFFAGEFTGGEAEGRAAEHEPDWLPVSEAERECFHACHAWAVQMASGRAAAHVAQKVVAAVGPDAQPR